MADDGTPRRAGAEFSRAELRFIRNHAGDGASVLAELLERPVAELLEAAYEWRIDVPPRPVLGEVCPWCGRRMTTDGTGYKRAGICDACYRRHRMEARASAMGEVEAIRADDLERYHRHRERHGA